MGKPGSGSSISLPFPPSIMQAKNIVGLPPGIICMRAIGTFAPYLVAMSADTASRSIGSPIEGV